MVAVGVLVNGVMEESLARLPAHYEELRILDMPKPWSWNTIMPVVQDIIIAAKPYPSIDGSHKWDANTEQWVPKIAVLP
jgi:hypothetical protein